MHQFPVLNFQDFIQVDGETVKTTSRHVAAVFGKRHDDVLRTIRKRLEDAGEWGLRNFTETLYTDSQNGQIYPCFEMTKNGFVFLTQKFSGKKAAAFQIAYIEAFDAMASYIKNQREGLQFQYFRKELEFKTRKNQISHAAREMRCWQQEKPERLSEINQLLSDMQPSLPIH